MDNFREDSRHALPPLTGGGESVGGGVQEANQGVRPHVQGVTEGTGYLQGVWGYEGGGIPGDSLDDSAWEVGRDAMDLKNPGREGRATDISNGIPGQGGPTELPGGGMPRPSGNADGDGGALPALACPQHRGHYVGGKLPPPTVHLMRHDGPPARPERQAPCHSPGI